MHADAPPPKAVGAADEATLDPAAGLEPAGDNDRPDNSSCFPPEPPLKIPAIAIRWPSIFLKVQFLLWSCLRCTVGVT